MLSRRPKAKIYSVEHDQYWFTEYRKRYAGYRGVTIFYLPVMAEYFEKPAKLAARGGLFDLVMVDGTERVECLFVANRVLKPEGYIVLHDADRDEYKPGLKALVLEKFSDHTMILRRSDYGKT